MYGGGPRGRPWEGGSDGGGKSRGSERPTSQRRIPSNLQGFENLKPEIPNFNPYPPAPTGVTDAPTGATKVVAREDLQPLPVLLHRWPGLKGVSKPTPRQNMGFKTITRIELHTGWQQSLSVPSVGDPAGLSQACPTTCQQRCVRVR